MTDAARPIDKPTRGRDVLGDAMLRWRETRHPSTPMVYVEATNDGQPTSDIHELLDRLEAKVERLLARRFPEAATDPWEEQG